MMVGSISTEAKTPMSENYHIVSGVKLLKI
jgi:hypothetical protein